MDNLVTEDINGRMQRLVEVATEMLVSQGITKRGNEGGIRSLRARLEEVFTKAVFTDLPRRWSCSTKDGRYEKIKIEDRRPAGQMVRLMNPAGQFKPP